MWVGMAAHKGSIKMRASAETLFSRALDIAREQQVKLRMDVGLRFDQQRTLRSLVSASGLPNPLAKVQLTARIRKVGTASMSREGCVVYDPEQLSLMGVIFDRTFGSLPREMRTPFNRMQMAKNLMSCIDSGELDPAELELAALSNLAVAVAA